MGDLAAMTAKDPLLLHTTGSDMAVE